MTEIEITAIVSDQMIRVEIVDALAARITVRDLVTGAQATVFSTTRQLGALMHLLIAGDDGNGELYEKYQLEQLMTELTQNGECPQLRCIP